VLDHARIATPGQPQRQMRASAVPFGHDVYFQPPADGSRLAIKMQLHLRAIVNKLAHLPANGAVEHIRPNPF
jgi:hypothetical protein